MNLLEKIKEKIKANNVENEVLAALIGKLPPEGVELEKANVSVSVFGKYVDIDDPSRQDTERLLSVLNGGRWIKETSCVAKRLNYITADEYVLGKLLRLWAAEPPGTCRIVKKKIIVPAQPEREEEVEEMICTPELSESDPI